MRHGIWGGVVAFRFRRAPQLPKFEGGFRFVVDERAAERPGWTGLACHSDVQDAV